MGDRRFGYAVAIVAAAMAYGLTNTFGNGNSVIWAGVSCAVVLGGNTKDFDGWSLIGSVCVLLCACVIGAACGWLFQSVRFGCVAVLIIMTVCAAWVANKEATKQKDMAILGVLSCVVLVLMGFTTL